MDKNALTKIVTHYDVESLTNRSKKLFRKIVFQISIYALLFVLSILAIIFLGQYLWVFILGIITAGISAFMCTKQFKKISFADCNNAIGEIAEVHKEIKIIRTTKVGGINPFGVRRYDQDAKNEIRLGIFIKNGEQVRGCFLNDGTEEHAKYYEAKGKAMHIWGTHFPVKLEIGKEKWLCPFCGEFNENEENDCVRCNKRIMK